jgi:hypothetical protein
LLAGLSRFAATPFVTVATTVMLVTLVTLVTLALLRGVGARRPVMTAVRRLLGRKGLQMVAASIFVLCLRDFE